jgi:hypothetical protein
MLPKSVHAVWTNMAVDNPKNFDNLTDRSLALDIEGNPHIAYGEEHLYHAYFDEGLLT